jgi:hypothetical protein
VFDSCGLLTSGRSAFGAVFHGHLLLCANHLVVATMWLGFSRARRQSENQAMTGAGEVIMTYR